MTSKVMITLFLLFSELERDLISLRTKEALTNKKSQGIQLGKPKGTIQKSKFDKDQEKIKELLALGLSVRKIANLLGFSNHIGLHTYVKKRSLRLTLHFNIRARIQRNVRLSTIITYFLTDILITSTMTNGIIMPPYINH